MDYTMRKLPGESIIIFTAGPEFDIGMELGKTVVDLLELLKDETAPVIYILDLLALPPVSMEDITLTANTLTRGESPVYHHPKLGRIIAVTPNPILQIAYKGLSNEMFGNLDVCVFDKLADALANARTG